MNSVNQNFTLNEIVLLMYQVNNSTNFLKVILYCTYDFVDKSFMEKNHLNGYSAVY